MQVEGGTGGVPGYARVDTVVGWYRDAVVVELVSAFVDVAVVCRIRTT